MADGTVFLKARPGEEIIAALAEFVNDRKIYAGTFSAIGAVREAELGHWSPRERAYHRVVLRGPLEILSLQGSVTRTEDGLAHVHPHIVLGDRDMKAVGGHVFYAVADPTCELVLRPFKGVVDRKADQASGLKLWSLKEK